MTVCFVYVKLSNVVNDVSLDKLNFIDQEVGGFYKWGECTGSVKDFTLVLEINIKEAAFFLDISDECTYMKDGRDNRGTTIV